MISWLENFLKVILYLQLMNLYTRNLESLFTNSFSADIEREILTKVEKKFESAKLLQNQLHYEVGKGVINALLSSKEINTKVFRKIFKDETYNKILGANVFAYHPSRNTVTFQSRS